MLALWKVGDELDVFESAWNFDHFEPIFSDRSGPCFEGWTMLAAMSQATQRLRIGCMVTGNPYRHPAVLAKMAATVDVISNGRLEFGLGAGWNETECQALGIELAPLGERFDRFDEALEVIVGLLTQPRYSFAGRHYRLDQAYCEPKPIQRPHPPIVIGGGGERRTLRSVARWAQIWNLPGSDPATLIYKRDVLDEHCRDIGRDPSEIVTSVQVRYQPELGTGALIDEIDALESAGMDLAIVLIPPPHDAGVLSHVAEALRDRA